MALIPGSALADGGLADELGQGVDVTRQDETGKVGFIGTENGAPIDVGLPASASAAKVATTFITDNANSFGLAGEGASLEVTDTKAAAGDGTSVRLQQLEDGLPVLGGELVVDLDANGNVLSVLGETSPSPSATNTPSVSADDAADAALGAIARSTGIAADELTAGAPELQVYDPRLLSAPSPLQSGRTAWVLEVTADSRPEPVRELVVVDAELGSVALHFDQIENAKTRSVCDANNTSAQYPCSSPVWTEGVTPTGQDADVALAYNYAGNTYDFFFTRFGRDSLNGAGLPLVSTIDYCDPSSACPYANAFWDGSQMVYGDGFAAADDVVGHELSHGFTEFTSHLFYYQQSGAINESMSDVFGEYIDQTNGAGTDTTAVKWKLGEDIPAIGAIRDMKTPGTFGDPDRMTSGNYTSDSGEGDGGGVHTNSGVNNKAAYLIADGTTAESGGTFNGQTITGIGITKAARIYYAAETTMLVSGSDYADLGNALNQACTNSIGTDGITAGDCTQVAKAVTATEMGTNPTNSPTVTAPTCTSGSPVNTFFDNLEAAPNGTWTTGTISGTGAWYYPQSSNPGSFDATYTTSGTKNLWGYDQPAASDSFVRTTNAIAVPANAFLRFDHAYGFEDDAGAAYDGGVVEYSTGGAGGPWTDAGSLFDSGSGYTGTIASGFSNPLAGRSAFVRESNGYGASRLNLSSLAGQNVMFRFRVGSDSSIDDFGWFIDDVRLYTCNTGSTLSIADAAKAEGNSGQSNADLTVTLSPAAGSTVTVNYTTSDGTATQPADYVTTSGTLTFTAGQTAKTISVPVKGDTLDENNETVNVDLSSPSGATIADGHADLTITDDDPAPTLSIADVSKTEGNSGQSNADVTVTLSTVSGKTVTVNYTTSDGTATQPADYVTTSGTLTFTAGQTTKTISVPVKGDTLDENNELVNVDLSSPSGATIADGHADLTITDDDGAPTLSIADASKAEGNSGQSNADLTVTLSPASGVTVTVNYTTSDGTATQPADYVTTSGTLTFTAGQTTKTISVPVKGDTLDENDELVNVDLSSPSGAPILDGHADLTITDDDAPPTVSIADVSKTEGNSGHSNADLAVNLSTASGRTVTVDYASADGSATEQTDYTGVAGTLTFTAGQTSTTVSVSVAGDIIDEPDETFSVALSAPSNVTIADGTGVGTILDDDLPGGQPNPPDTTAPETKIDSGPPKKTRKRQATFRFSSSEPGSFQCALDDDPFAPCSSPTTLKAKKGKHTFSVRAKDASGNVAATVATYSWRVQKTRRHRH